MKKGAGVVLAVTLAARLAVLVWSWGKFPATADGHYYDVLADRLAHGLGYTWAWPDGAVTYAAHYPVGYPAALSLAYRWLGAGPGAASWLNLVVGSIASVAGYVVARDAFGPRAAIAAGVVAALEPALLLYQPAVMTEAFTGHLLVIATSVVVWSRAREGRAQLGALAVTGLLLGLATLVRPQSLLFAPAFGALAARGAWTKRGAAALLVTATTLLVCAPWTARNCARMKQCALVSVNGGWNLLIGAAPGSEGHWAPVEVPDECKTVFDEAKKDRCFGDAAQRRIAAEPLRWLSVVPKKLAATFDYGGAAPWYLHEANPGAFGWRMKEITAVVETVAHRLILVAALLGLARWPGPNARARWVVAGLSALVALSGIVTHSQHGGWIAHLGLIPLALLLGRGVWSGPSLVPVAATVVALTGLVHAAFFGAGRYGLPAYPFIALLSLSLFAVRPHPETTRT